MADKRDAETVRSSFSMPDYQREVWNEEAEEMGISFGEYVRMMIQAGRRELGYTEPDSDPSNGPDLESQIIDILEEHDGDATWSELIDGVLGDLEDEIEDTVGELEEEGVVETSLRSNTISLKR